MCSTLLQRLRNQRLESSSHTRTQNTSTRTRLSTAAQKHSHTHQRVLTWPVLKKTKRKEKNKTKGLLKKECPLFVLWTLTQTQTPPRGTRGGVCGPPVVKCVHLSMSAGASLGGPREEWGPPASPHPLVEVIHCCPPAAAPCPRPRCPGGCGSGSAPRCCASCRRRASCRAPCAPG